jgi:hypothetical protein
MFHSSRIFIQCKQLELAGAVVVYENKTSHPAQSTHPIDITSGLRPHLFVFTDIRRFVAARCDVILHVPRHSAPPYICEMEISRRTLPMTTNDNLGRCDARAGGGGRTTLQHDQTLSRPLVHVTDRPTDRSKFHRRRARRIASQRRGRPIARKHSSRCCSRCFVANQPPQQRGMAGRTLSLVCSAAVRRVDVEAGA